MCVCVCVCVCVRARTHSLQLCPTPWTVARQAPLSMGFSRQEHWSGLPLPETHQQNQSAVMCLSKRDAKHSP